MAALFSFLRLICVLSRVLSPHCQQRGTAQKATKRQSATNRARRPSHRAVAREAYRSAAERLSSQYIYSWKTTIDSGLYNQPDQQHAPASANLRRRLVKQETKPITEQTIKGAVPSAKQSPPQQAVASESALVLISDSTAQGTSSRNQAPYPSSDRKARLTTMSGTPLPSTSPTPAMAEPMEMAEPAAECSGPPAAAAKRCPPPGVRAVPLRERRATYTAPA